MNQPVTHKMYYAAILCPPEADEKVRLFKQWMKERFGCVAALRSPAHITLVPPFWLEEKRESELLQTFQSFTSDMNELEIRLDGFSHFNKKVLFIRVKENPAIEELRNQAENHFIRSFGDIIKKDDRPFHPHVTIATRDMKPPDFIPAWEYFSKKDFTAAFHVKTISLLKLSPANWIVIGEKNW